MQDRDAGKFFLWVTNYTSNKPQIIYVLSLQFTSIGAKPIAKFTAALATNKYPCQSTFELNNICFGFTCEYYANALSNNDNRWKVEYILPCFLMYAVNSYEYSY